MKTRLTFLVLLLFFISFEGLHAQPGLFGGQAIPFKPQSPLFGKDIVINDSSSQNQRQVAVCSAFNGWLYAVYSYTYYINNFSTFEIFKSTDNGTTWSMINNVLFGGDNAKYLSLDIATTGDSISNLKVFIAAVVTNNSYGNGGGYVWQFDAETGDFVNLLFRDAAVRYIAICTDNMYPANNSSPNSLGILYSKHSIMTNDNDSLIFCSSSDGGLTINNRQVVYVASQKTFNKVALSYGRSPSWSSGRYFAAWEDRDSYYSPTGHIFTAHTLTDINAPFTTPIKLDSLDSSLTGLVRSPTIASQFSGSDNDSSNLTEVIMFEKQLSSGNYDTKGFYNLQATTSNHFNEFTVNSSSNNKLQPDICFNSYTSNFMLTYYDTLTNNLPFLINDVNLSSPGSWNIVTQAYNDSPDIAAPYPKVILNQSEQEGANVWVKEGTGGNGVAMFDAPYSTWTGISGNGSVNDQSLRVYPNPCNSLFNIAFELKGPETVNITLFDQMGERIGTVTDQAYSQGHNLVTYNVSGLVPGVYFLTFVGENSVLTRKVLISR